MTKTAKLATLAVVPVALAGWALFRPELLFVDQKVSEKLPVAAQATLETLREGEFTSSAHETTGQAAFVQTAGKRYLRLSGFRTSNGPDVHVLLVKGSDPSALQGSYDLGSIKGNVGDQNYELPAQVDPADYGAVTIWCKRFDVVFGGASLSPLPMASAFQTTDGWTLASYAPEGAITVTSGPFKGRAGLAAIVERDGKRFLELAKVKPAPGLRVLLVKAETLTRTSSLKATSKLDLGPLRAPKAAYAVPKSVDVWLYRSVALWDARQGRIVATADLRSDQERDRSLFA